MRIAINTKDIATAADLQRVLRSAAAKLDADALTPGADFEVGNVRVQVADKQVSDIRAFAHKFEFPVGSRGRYSKLLTEAWDIYSTAPDKRKVLSQVRKLAAEARGAVVEVEEAELIEA